MRGIRTAGACLLAVFAFSVVAAPAQAAPEFGRCVKLAKAKGAYADNNCTKLYEKKGEVLKKGDYEWEAGAPPSCVAQAKGEYTDSACTEKSVKAHKGSYEKEPGPGFTTRIGAIEFKTPALGGPWVCAKGSGSGEITSATTVVATFTYEECESGAKKFTSPGEPAGTIVTSPLDGTLVEVRSGEVSTVFQSESGPSGYISEFNWEGPLLRVMGEIGGEDFPLNVSSIMGFERFENGLGVQALETELNAGTGWLGPAPTLQEASLTNTYASAVEIKN